VTMSLPVPGMECYGLNMKCPAQAHGFNTWSSAAGAILGDAGN
jgi:hypothetical protein